jgi:glycosyltransferase domain-containing protein
LIRALSYYVKVGFKGWICIGDSSNVQHSERIKRVVCALEDKIKIIYKFFPKPPYMNDSMCLKEMIEIAPTPYLVYSGDDDLLVPSSLGQCAAFLEKHPEYSAAHGYRILFHLNTRNGKDYIVKSDYIQQHILEAEKASERWLGYIRHAFSTQFYVQRKETWRRMYRDIPLVSSKYLGPELMPCSLTAILGKVKQLDCLSTLFQSTSGSDGSWSNHSLYHFALSSDWSTSVQGFRNSIVEALMEKDNMKGKQANEIFDREFWHHIKVSFAWPYQIRYGSFPNRKFDVACNVTNYHENAYSLLIDPNWPHAIKTMRESQVKVIIKNVDVDPEKAEEMFDKDLWGQLLILLTWQYQRKYGAENFTSINQEMDKERSLGHEYNRMLSLEAMLNPSSPYHMDFLPAYKIVTGDNSIRIHA